MKYHRNAKTNIFVRKQIARRISDGEPVTKVAREFGITGTTAYKWASREDFKDKTSMRNRLLVKMYSMPTTEELNLPLIDPTITFNELFHKPRIFCYFKLFTFHINL